MADRFTTLKSNEAGSPLGLWNWAKRLTNDLNKLRRLWDLADADLTGKAGHNVRVKADESGFEIVP